MCISVLHFDDNFSRVHTAEIGSPEDWTSTYSVSMSDPYLDSQYVGEPAAPESRM